MKVSLNILGLSAMLLVSLAMACAPRPATVVASDAPQVKIDNFSFTPATITVPVGTTLRWTNHDDIPHTVVANDKSFKSKALDTDESFSFTFSKAGTYEYFCSIHPKMTGKVVVQ